MCQLILINLKLHSSPIVPRACLSCSSCNSPHRFPLFSNLNISIVIAQLCTEKVPFFQNVLLRKRQCFELLANIITRVPTNFLKNANLLTYRRDFLIGRFEQYHAGAKKCTWKARFTLKRHNLVSSKQSAGESHPAQNTRAFHTSL